MHAAQPSICASAHACFCMAARLHMQTAAPASARAHRCAGMTAVQACVRGGRTATLSPAFWCCQPGPGRWYRSAAGAGGCSSIPRTPWYGSLRAFVLGNGDVPRCGRVSSHMCAYLNSREPGDSWKKPGCRLAELRGSRAQASGGRQRHAGITAASTAKR